MRATAVPSRRAQQRTRGLGGLRWVTWRQHRLAIAAVVVVLGGLSVFMLFNGLAMHHAYTSLGLNTCGKIDGPGCQTQLAIFQQQYVVPWGDHLPHLLMFLPGLIGMFVGAPLVARELESGTFRFAWTQGRTRLQWAVTKLVLLGVSLTAIALGFSAVFSWWYGAFDTVSSRMTTYGAYEVAGLTFAARTLFGFTLGALLGLLIRRTVPAMAATGAAWIAAMLASVTYLRPLIRRPVTVMGALAKGPNSGSGSITLNADVVSHWTQDAAGQHLDDQQLFDQATVANGGTSPSPQQFHAYLTQHHYSQWASYRPNDWFWHYQILEASGYTILALLLAVATVLLVRRRTA